MDNYSDGLASGLAIGQNSNYGYGNGFGYGWEWIWIIILFAFWGNGGYGFGNNGAGGVSGEIQRGFDTASITTKLDGITNGLCDGFYAMNTSLLTGFGNTNTAIMQNGYETRSAINDLGYRLQDLGCQTQRSIDAVNYNMAKNTCDITNAINESTNQILGFMTQEKISALQAENAALTAQLSQNAQTQTLINTLRPCPIPSYPVCSPYESILGNGYGFRQGNTCGCGCN